MIGSYGRKYRVKPRFFIFILLFLALGVWALVSLVRALQPARIEWGQLSSDQVLDALALRDEALVQSPEYAKLSCIAAEGQAVKLDEPVAMLYKSGYSEKDISKLLQLESTIKDYQENNILKDIVNKDLDSINTKIKDKMDEISASTANMDTQSLLVSEQELRSYMAERKDFMQGFVQADETLNMYYQQEKALQDKIDQTRVAVKAKTEGLVSFYLDGHESQLTIAALANMTPAVVRELQKKVMSEGGSSRSDDIVEANQTLCRIVNPNYWYALIVMNKSENHMAEGSDYPMTFDGLKNTVTAHVEKIVTEGRNSLIILKIAEGVPEVLSLRLLRGWMGQDVEGFRVPLRMISQDGEKNFIAVKQDGSTKRIEVKLLGKDERYAIIAEAGGSDSLVLGLELTTP